jgi:hypothetical protein
MSFPSGVFIAGWRSIIELGSRCSMSKPPSLHALPLVSLVLLQGKERGIKWDIGGGGKY